MVRPSGRILGRCVQSARRQAFRNVRRLGHRYTNCECRSVCDIRVAEEDGIVHEMGSSRSFRVCRVGRLVRPDEKKCRKLYGHRSSVQGGIYKIVNYRQMELCHAITRSNTDTADARNVSDRDIFGLFMRIPRMLENHVKVCAITRTSWNPRSSRVFKIL